MLKLVDNVFNKINNNYEICVLLQINLTSSFETKEKETKTCKENAGNINIKRNAQ